MLSLELEDKLIGEDITAIWSELKQKYLSNGQEEATLFLTTEKNKTYNFPGINISIIYNGTDKDFAEKYNLYINTLTREKYVKELMRKYNMPECEANLYTDDMDDIFLEYGSPQEIIIS